MAIANGLATKSTTNLFQIGMKDEVLEKVMICQDLAGLTAHEKIAYIGNLCKTLGLNPYTKPFEIMKFNGKEVPYARKDCTEQLRKINNVSITRLDTKMVEGGIYIVTAYAERAGGVKDSATGVISVSGLKGEALGNAMMKAETKAKRRVTLSICGLGFLDETEVETVPNVEKINVVEMSEKEPKKSLREHAEEVKAEIVEEDRDIEQDLLDISWTSTIDELQEVYAKSYKHWMNKKHKENMKRCVDAKDAKKDALEAEALKNKTEESAK